MESLLLIFLAHFGVMESAETIEQGNFKLLGYPMVVLGEDGRDDELGLAVRGGYGFTDALDGEVGAVFYDGVTLLGGNVELLLARAQPAAPRPTGVNVSVRGGLNLLRGDAEDATSLNLSAIASTHVADRAELVGALDYNRFMRDEPRHDADTLHLVPGLEYQITRQLDLLVEFALGLTDDDGNHIAGGLSYYIR